MPAENEVREVAGACIGCGEPVYEDQPHSHWQEGVAHDRTEDCPATGEHGSRIESILAQRGVPSAPGYGP